jgi:hypothetical protein
MEENYHFCRNGLSYYSNSKYKQLSLEVSGNYLSPMDFYVKYSGGTFSKIFKNLPLKRASGWFIGMFRYSFLVVCKTTSEKSPSSLS